MEHSKTNYGLMMVMLLTDDSHYSVSELAEEFETTEEDVSQYLEVLEDTGFILDKWDGGYALQSNEANLHSLQKVLKFNVERYIHYYRTISKMPDSTPGKDSLLKKLQGICEIYVPEKCKYLN